MNKTKVFSAIEKEKCLKYAESNGVNKAIEKFGCTERSFYRWKKSYDGTLQSLEPITHKGESFHPNSHTPEEIANINKVMNENPHIYMKDLYEILVKDYGYTRSLGGMKTFIDRHLKERMTKYKNDYSTMFDTQIVDYYNEKYLYENKNELPEYIIELSNLNIYLAKNKTTGDPCQLTMYFSTALKFKSEEEAKLFIKDIPNKSKHKLTVKKISL